MSDLTKKKRTKSKAVLVRPEKLSNLSQSDKECLGMLVAFLIIVISFTSYLVFHGPKYSFGDCLLNRKFEIVRVWSVSPRGYSRFYGLEPTKISATYEGWSVDFDLLGGPSQYKFTDFVDDSYVKIPCESKPDNSDIH